MKEMICQNCETACRVTVERDAVAYVISGHQCSRGRAFAMEELSHPMRELIAAVRIDRSFAALPVRLSAPVPRERVAAVLKELSRYTALPPVVGGQVLIADLLGLGADVIACADIAEET